MKNETTSAGVARIAARILHLNVEDGNYIWQRGADDNNTCICSVEDLKSLAASALTQVPNKKKKAK